MDKDSKGQRKLEDWRRSTSCSGRTQHKNKIEEKRRQQNCIGSVVILTFLSVSTTVEGHSLRTK